MNKTDAEISLNTIDNTTYRVTRYRPSDQGQVRKQQTSSHDTDRKKAKTDTQISRADALSVASQADSVKKYGSFQDSLRAPVHRWFTYPAGYSHKLVEQKIEEYGLGRQHWIMDPFVGTGTTSVAAKAKGVNSIGVEAHPFVFWVAKTKLHSDLDVAKIEKDAATIQDQAKVISSTDIQYDGVWPALIYKCFAEDNLRQLLSIRTAILQHKTSPERRDFFKVALTATLRDVTSAGAGWPYIAPSKYAKRTVHREAFVEFRKRVDLMLSDIFETNVCDAQKLQHNLFNGDARNLEEYADRNSVDMVLTSPPYLNNYDYADRTRLETYFWGIYESWGDITRQVRDHLIIAATTQIRRSEMDEVRSCPSVLEVSREIHAEISRIVDQLSQLRLVKGGKKSYDLMVAGYFEDMLKVIQGVYKVLKPGQPFVLVLGDSAPYGVHVRTDEIIGELAIAAGFTKCDIQVIRKRGDKWAGNSQRHKVPLRESIVTIIK